APLRLKFHSRQHWIKKNGRRDFVPEVKLVNRLKALGIAVEALEHHFLVFVGDVDVGDLGGAVDHLARDFWLVFRHGPEHAGQQRGGQSQMSASSQKSPAVEHEASCG